MKERGDSIIGSKTLKPQRVFRNTAVYLFISCSFFPSIVKAAGLDLHVSSDNSQADFCPAGNLGGLTFDNDGGGVTLSTILNNGSQITVSGDFSTQGGWGPGQGWIVEYYTWSPYGWDLLSPTFYSSAPSGWTTVADLPSNSGNCQTASQTTGLSGAQAACGVAATTCNLHVYAGDNGNEGNGERVYPFTLPGCACSNSCPTGSCSVSGTTCNNTGGGNYQCVYPISLSNITFNDNLPNGGGQGALLPQAVTQYTAVNGNTNTTISTLFVKTPNATDTALANVTLSDLDNTANTIESFSLDYSPSNQFLAGFTPPPYPSISSNLASIPQLIVSQNTYSQMSLNATDNATDISGGNSATNQSLVLNGITINTLQLSPLSMTLTCNGTTPCTANPTTNWHKSSDFTSDTFIYNVTPAIIGATSPGLALFLQGTGAGNACSPTGGNSPTQFVYTNVGNGTPFTVPPSGSIADGKWFLSTCAQVPNTTLNAQTPGGIEFDIDNIAPTISTSNITASGSCSGTYPNFTCPPGGTLNVPVSDDMSGVQTAVLTWPDNSTTSPNGTANCSTPGCTVPEAFTIPSQSPNTYAVTLTATDNAGNTTPPLTLNITIPAGPQISNVSPNPVTAGSPDTTVTITGLYFVASGPTQSIAQWCTTSNSGCSNIPTTVNSATTITAVIPHGDLGTANTFWINVINGTTPCNPFYAFTVAPKPVPTINTDGTGLNPASVPENNGAFVLTVNGTNFVSGTVDVVQWAGADLATTYVNPTQLTASVPAADVAIGKAGPYPITVQDTSSGGQQSNSVNFIVTPLPAPSISSLNPSGAQVGAPGFTLTVNGNDFVNGATPSVVQWNGAPVATTYINGSQLTIPVTTSMLGTTPTNIPVTVCNAGTTQCSSAFDFVVTAKPVPTINTDGTGLSPSSAQENSGGFTLTVNGTNFVPGSVDIVQWNGAALATTYISPTQLSATVPASDVAIGQAGPHPITVQDTSAGGQTSNAVNFNVTALPAPSISSLNPTTAEVGAANFTLTINGSNFVNGTSPSVAQWNSAPVATTYINNSQLTIPVTTAMLGTSAANIPVTVCNGSVCSSGFNFVVTAKPAPTINTDGTGLNPASVPENNGSFVLTVNGTNFVSGTVDVVQWAGSALATTYISPTQLSATVPASDVALGQAGPHAITVQDTSSGGQISNAVNFNVTALPAPSISSLNPTTAEVGAAGFTLTINGSNFVNGTSPSVVQWGTGGPVATTYINNSQLTIPVTTAMLGTSAANIPVTVCNGSVCSSGFNFVVTAKPIPTINTDGTGLNPSSVVENSGAFVLTVNGTNFASGSVDIVQWNGAALATTYISPTQLSASVPAVDVAIGQAGPHPITVQDTSSGGGLSNAVNFNVTALPAPSISSLNPTTAEVGATAFTLTINGSNFVNGTSPSVAQWNSAPVATTYINNSQLTIPVTTAMLGTTAANIPVTVCNGSVCSSGFNFVVTNKPAPTINTDGTGLNPSSVVENNGAFVLTVNGTNFVSGTVDVVQWAGADLATTYVSPTQLTASVPAADVALGQAGPHAITVQDTSSGGQTSNAVNFNVTALPVPNILSLTPASVPVGNAPFILAITGSGFASGDIIKFGAFPITSTYFDASDIETSGTINLTDYSITTPQTVSVTVCPVSGPCSASFDFNVTAKPAPTINTSPIGLNPSSATEGDPATPMTITGTNFTVGSSVDVLLWNSVAKPLTCLTTTSCSYTIPASDLAVGTHGLIPVAIQDTSAGGSTSNAVNFTINPKPIPPDHTPLGITSLNDPTVNTDTTFTVNIRVNPADNPLPSFANVTFQYVDDTGATVNGSYTNPAALTVNSSNVMVVQVSPSLTATGNRNYTNIQARVSTLGTTGDPSWSPFTTLTPAPNAWTLPSVPAAPYSPSVSNTSISANIDYPATNSAQTKYYLQMVQNTADFSGGATGDPLINSTPVNDTMTSPVTLSGLAYTNYYIRTYVISNSPWGNTQSAGSFDVQSLTLGPVETAGPAINGSIVTSLSTTNSLTGSWTTTSNFLGVTALEAQATNYADGTVTSTNTLTTPFTTPIQITVGGLPFANTSYTLSLWNDTNSPALYAGSSTNLGYTLVAQPTTPTLSFTGSNNVLVMNIGLTPETPIQNSQDTLYSIAVSTLGAPLPLYLVGDGTVLATPTYRTMTDWMSGKNIFNNPVLDSTYTVTVGAEQVPTPNTIVSFSNAATIVTPHKAPQGPNPPNPVTNLYSLAVGPTEIVWTWTAPAANGATQLVLMDGLTNNIVSTNVYTSNTGTLYQWKETGLALGQTVSRYIASVDVTGTSYSNLATATTLTQAGTFTLGSDIFTTGMIIDGTGFGVDTTNFPYITLVFSGALDQNSIGAPGAITLQQGTVMPGGVQWSPVSLAAPVLSASSQIQLSLASGNWNKNQLYLVTLSTQITDAVGDVLTPASVPFYTLPDPTLTNTMSAVDANGLVTHFTIPANTLPQGGFPVIRDSFGPNTASMSAPGLSPTQVINSSLGIIPTATIREIMMFASPNNQLATFGTNAPSVVSIEYPNSTTQAARAAATGSGLTSALTSPSLTGLTMYSLNSTAHRPTPVPGASLDTGNGVVTASLTTPGIYFIASPVSTSLSSAYAYPVPFRPAAGNTSIKFDNLGVGSTIKVYTIMGALVWEGQSADGSKVVWPVTNNDGANVASGVYIYQIKNSFDEKRGKLIIIR